ncbi:MAG: glycerate kinase [Elusimicrobia bacterium]|nr:glycerate kinase [Elusimicrobiota bacterium]
MRILLAPNAFKGTIGPLAAARALGAAAAKAGHLPALMPISDGGDGLTEALAFGLGGRRRTRLVKNALGRGVRASYLLLAGGKAVIEMAQASGLAALGGEKNKPMSASSCGTGELIRAALDDGARSIIVGLGGSACNDAGTGMAAALGVKFYDASGRELAPGTGPLRRLAKIDFSGLDPRIAKIRITAFTDVRNPLLGPLGSARVYGPQKGATSAQVAEMEKALVRLCAVLGKQGLEPMGRKPGGAAAGGVAAGLAVFLGAELKCGAGEVLELLGAEQRVSRADLVVTGEGRLDEQTAFGKAPAALAALCRRMRKPLMFVCAQNRLSASKAGALGIGGVVSFEDLGATEAQSRACPEKWLKKSLPSLLSA